MLQPIVGETLGSERFLREVDVIPKLQHPHVLTLIDSGEAEGLPYYVMPLVKGMSLAKKLEVESALSIDEAVDITIEIADAHTAGALLATVAPPHA